LISHVPVPAVDPLAALALDAWETTPRLGQSIRALADLDCPRFGPQVPVAELQRNLGERVQ